MNRFKIIAVLAVLFIPLSVSAHSGGTDDNGGHHCYTDCKQHEMQVGEYHYHDEDDNPIATYDKNEDVFDRGLAERLKGEILLQTEKHGEAWYINPVDYKRYYMKDGEVAYEMMRSFGHGIANKDLGNIPTVSDTSEMQASNEVCSTNSLANRLRGEILLQVEEHGEAWYVDPDKCRRIYMKDGAAAYEIMRFLGLGIVNSDLAKLPTGVVEIENGSANESDGNSTQEQDTAEEMPKYTLNGYGADFSQPFELQRGMMFVTAEHTNGDSNFITHLLDSEGKTEAYLVNEIGEYEGRTIYHIDEPGEYRLNVDADGSWDFTISQKQPDVMASVPASFDGGIGGQFGADDYIGPISMTSGLHTAKMSQMGDSNFIVHLLNSQGEIVEFLANEIGDVTANTAFNVPEDGNYYLLVDGDGSWSIEIERG